PDHWAGRRVEAVIDLGFHRDAAGFQCEGLVVDDAGLPVQGIHPRRTNVAVGSKPGPVVLMVEAASNPSFPQFRPSPLGSPATAGEERLYRFRRAELVVVDSEAEALMHDLEVIDGVMRSLALDDPRRPRLLRDIERALDAVPDVAAARHAIEPALALPARSSAHHIIATGHAHIDTAWLWPIRETRRKCERTFASAVRLMDEHPGYRFVCSQAQQYAWIEERRPELFARIAAKVDSGQWVPVGGMWVESDMNLPSGESLVRQIVHGQRYFEQHFGQRCTEVWIPDVFGYPAGLPQVFAAGGMKRFVTQKLSWNKQNRFPHHTFWWEGLDGTRVLTHFPPVDTYNAEITPAECAHAVENFSEHGWSDWSLMPFGHGDGGGGPTREMLHRAHRLADLDGAPRVEIGTPAEFFQHVEREIHLGAPVPVWRGELYFETHRGTLTSQIRTKLGNRRCERLLREVELWAATSGVAADVDELWREVLTQQFHDILPGSSIAWVHADAEATHTRIEQQLRERIDAFVETLAPGSATLTNVASHDRDEIVIIGELVDDDLSTRSQSGSGPTQSLAAGGLAFRAAIPGNGMAPVLALPVDDHVVVTDRSMTNRHLAVRWDEGGNLTSIIDVDHAREVLPERALAAVLELAIDHPVEYDAWDLEAWTPPNATPITTADRITVTDNGPLVGTVRVDRAFGDSTASVTYSLRAGSPRLDIHIDVDWHEHEHLLSMVFPLDVRADTATCDVQFGSVRRPTHPTTSWDAAKFEVCAHRFVDVAEPEFGVAILNNGRYGHGVFDGQVRVSLLRAARYPDPDADQGRHSVDVALYPHGSGLADVVREAERFNTPVRAVRGSAAEIATPIVSLTGAGVEIDAIKLADDASGDLVVRLHEACGDRRHVTVRADRRILGASRCNLLEEPASGLEVGDGIAVLTLRPFELVTLRLTRASADYTPAR
ncbi:MAG TPA: glycoside hydrolase family 38 C-terminal domain-containing protein, partial [Ilumatobacteraceae bacterium]|nr:glycoside hydrolase family 38 C-terminal domain-containing protein [Ilumatobacteraceae bacterium]